MEIKNAVTLITGGASGIGKETARRFAAAGARVAIWDMNEAAGKAHAADIGGFFAPCDVTSEASVNAALEATLQALGVPRVVVQCAGILTAKRMIGKDGPADLEHFQRTIMVNLLGSYNVMRLSANAMSKAEANSEGERGVIINTASIAAYEGQIGQIAYAASKGGVVAMTLPAARELARNGIRVMAVAPGAVETPMINQLSDDVRAAICATIPFPSRFAKPEEFADLALHIAANPMLNGSVIRLDGAARLEPK